LEPRKFSGNPRFAIGEIYVSTTSKSNIHERQEPRAFTDISECHRQVKHNTLGSRITVMGASVCHWSQNIRALIYLITSYSIPHFALPCGFHPLSCKPPNRSLSGWTANSPPRVSAKMWWRILMCEGHTLPHSQGSPPPRIGRG